jgi:SPP1 family predicted phage head-tail adaptor
MGLGEFRNRIALQSISLSTDAGGGQSTSFSTSATVWARAENISGTEGLFGNQIRGTARYKFLIRYNSSITEKFRISYNSKTFNIIHIKDLYEGKKRYQEITATEGVAT